MRNKNLDKVIRTLIVDDENLARKRIKDLLCGKDDFEIIGECSNGKEAIEAIENHSPDLVFLDIQMPDMDGFKVVENLETKNLPTIIFVTAYDKYALKAFEIHAVDYLLKPFKDERFEETLEHISHQFKQNQIENISGKLDSLLSEINKDPTQSKGNYQSRFIIKSTGRISFIKVDEIDWIGAEGPYVSLNINKKAHLMRESLKNLEDKLDPNKFLRIHRSTIVNLSCIKELRPFSHGEYFVILEDGKRLKLSRTYRENLEKLLDEAI